MAGVHGTNIPAHLSTLVGGGIEQVWVPEDDVMAEVFQGESVGTIREELGDMTLWYCSADQMAVAQGKSTKTVERTVNADGWE